MSKKILPNVNSSVDKTQSGFFYEKSQRSNINRNLKISNRSIDDRTMSNLGSSRNFLVGHKSNSKIVINQSKDSLKYPHLKKEPIMISSRNLPQGIITDRSKVSILSTEKNNVIDATKHIVKQILARSNYVDPSINKSEIEKRQDKILNDLEDVLERKIKQSVVKGSLSKHSDLKKASLAAPPSPTKMKSPFTKTQQQANCDITGKSRFLRKSLIKENSLKKNSLNNNVAGQTSRNFNTNQTESPFKLSRLETKNSYTFFKNKNTINEKTEEELEDEQFKKLTTKISHVKEESFIAKMTRESNTMLQDMTN